MAHGLKALTLIRAALCCLLVGGCAGGPSIVRDQAPPAARARLSIADAEKAKEIVMFSFGLIGVDYRFGGRNPDSGLDCSGMVSYIYEQVSGLRLPHNAAEIARLTRPIAREGLRPGDLVFFNTLNRPYSHVGIYIGDDRFVHAPSSNGKIKISSLSNRYFAARYEGARSLFADSSAASESPAGCRSC